MANDVVMPRLGWTMEVGRVVEWLKQEGEAVEAGEPLFAVESDKAVTEVESLDSGILRFPADAPDLGVDVPVGARLAILVAADEAVTLTETSPSTTTQPRDGVEQVGLTATDRDEGTRSPIGHRGQPAISPRARRLAEARGLDWTRLAGSGRTGRIVERDIQAAMANGARPRATPSVRRLAEEQGVDLDQLAGRRAQGRISRADIQAAVAAQGVASPDVGLMGTRVSGVRQLIAARMSESSQVVAAVTLTTEADATELVHLRAHLKDELAGTSELVPSFTDLLTKLVALALLRHPALNASLVDGQVIEQAAAHIGIAVDTERGLMAPVVRDAHDKSVGTIALETAQLTVAARSGKISADDLHGGTFTISNLGMYDIDAFTPIVNLPECAVLGVGRIVPRPVVIDDVSETVAVRRMMALSLTFDHRLVDGAPAARFLQQVKRMIERPYVWLLK